MKDYLKKHYCKDCQSKEIAYSAYKYGGGRTNGNRDYWYAYFLYFEDGIHE